MNNNTHKPTTRILLIGKNGQVGWELQRTLATLGSIISMGWPKIDLSKPDSIRNVIADTSPTVILNAAAYTAVDKAESEPDLAMAINGTAMEVLSQEAKRLNAALVHYSTDYVYSGDKSEAYVETDRPAPKSVYGQSKLAGDSAIQASDIPHLILRTSWVYGNRGNNFLLTMRRLMTERPELKVVNDQFGAPTWCRAIAEATAQILVQCRELNPNGRLDISSVRGVYHLSCAGQTSWHGFAEAIRDKTITHPTECLIAPIPTSSYPTPAARPRNSVLSNAKLRNTFGVCLPDWNEALKLCLSSDD